MTTSRLSLSLLVLLLFSGVAAVSGDLGATARWLVAADGFTPRALG